MILELNKKLLSEQVTDCYRFNPLRSKSVTLNNFSRKLIVLGYE